VWSLAGLASLAWAYDTQQEVTDLAGDMAAALANNDAEGFLTHVAKEMPGRAMLRDNLFGLVAAADLNSSVEVIDLKTEGARTVVNFDWSLHVISKDDSSQVEQRHETVTLEVEKQGKRWKVVALKPVSFFGPINTKQH